jgi:hypothetical protein
MLPALDRLSLDRADDTGEVLFVSWNSLNAAGAAGTFDASHARNLIQERRRPQNGLYRPLYVIDGSNIFYTSPGGADWRWREEQLDDDWGKDALGPADETLRWDTKLFEGLGSPIAKYTETLPDRFPDQQRGFNMEAISDLALEQESVVPWQLTPRNKRVNDGQYKYWKIPPQLGDVVVVSSVDTYTFHILEKLDAVQELLGRFLDPAGKLFWVVIGPHTCGFTNRSRPCLDRVDNRCIFRFDPPRTDTRALHELCEFDDVITLLLCDAFRLQGGEPELITGDRKLRIFWKSKGHFLVDGEQAYFLATPWQLRISSYMDAILVWQEMQRAGRMRFGVGEFTIEELRNRPANRPSGSFLP